MTRRVAECAVAFGAEFVEEHRVTSLSELEAERVLVATDGYPSGVLGQFERLIVPTRGQMIATEPFPDRLFECPHFGRRGFDYWQQLEDGRMTAGGFRDVDTTTEFTAEEETTATIQAALEDFLASIVGRRLEVTHRWAGIFGLVLDFLPVVGRVPQQEGIWISAGYSGHGNVLGFMCGDLVARAMLGEESPQLELFDPERLLAAA
jgi:glycine/D-amino acid oxidase-like deaminating enzyme